MDPQSVSKWIETLGPTGVMALAAIAVGRWFDKSFWPWFQKIYERQIASLESILAVMNELRVASDDMTDMQRQIVRMVEEMRRDIAGLYERQGESPPSRQRYRGGSGKE